MLPGHRELVTGTDSFVVSPLFFPGGDIRSLAVHGTVNDLAMRGAWPLAVRLAHPRGWTAAGRTPAVLGSLGDAAQDSGVPVVTGDTKAVRRGAADKLFVNTIGDGQRHGSLRPSALARPGGAVLLSGPVGPYGTDSPCRRCSWVLTAAVPPRLEAMDLAADGFASATALLYAVSGRSDGTQNGGRPIPAATAAVAGLVLKTLWSSPWLTAGTLPDAGVIASF
ncbi:AIR synthase related protein [Streptomyces phaeochromogenes]